MGDQGVGDEPEGIVYLFLFWYPAPVQAPSILSHLMSPDFVGLDGASLEDLLQAQAETTSSLIGHSRAGADGSSGSLIDFNAHSETLTGLEAQAVRSAFAAVLARGAALPTMQRFLAAGGQTAAGERRLTDLLDGLHRTARS